MKITKWSEKEVLITITREEAKHIIERLNHNLNRKGIDIRQSGFAIKDDGCLTIMVDQTNNEDNDPQAKLKKMCHNCDWENYYCEECGECFDDCCCNNDDWPERYDDDYSSVCAECSRHFENCTCDEAELLCTFDEIDNWLLRGHFGLCSYYLRTLCVNKLSTAQMITILTTTLPASTKLQDRLGFYNRVHDILLKRKENANTLLSGLRGNKYDPATPEESLEVDTSPLPCPFCGEEVAPHELKDISPENSSRYYIRCWNDDCEVQPRIDRPSDCEEDVISRWNKRVERKK